MIVDENLPRGIIANTTAALGISLASQQSGLVGKQLKDKDGRTHEGITNVPIPILSLGSNDIKSLYDNLKDNTDENVRVIGFNDVAQKSHHYDDYEVKLMQAPKENIGYLGLCLYGPKKKVNKLTGSMKMLK
jgi:hypothetical protein